MTGSIGAKRWHLRRAKFLLWAHVERVVEATVERT
jgi:hypothetical protein